MDDPRFDRAVILVLSHDDQGTLGVALGHPEGVSGAVSGVLSGWLSTSPLPHSVFRGGPVQEDGFICLAEDAGSQSGVRSVDFLASDPVAGRRHRIYRGYSGWSGGQLEDEIGLGVWITAESSPDDVFCTEPEKLWSTVVRRQGSLLSRLADVPEKPWLN